MKVVFDTNILVSAFTLSGGRGDQALARIIHGNDALFISRSIIDELLGVLARKSEQIGWLLIRACKVGGKRRVRGGCCPLHPSKT